MVESLERARTLMRGALDLLDGCDAPADIGAHLDLAICRLDEALAIRTSSKEVPAATIGQSVSLGIRPRMR